MVRTVCSASIEYIINQFIVCIPNLSGNPQVFAVEAIHVNGDRLDAA